ncbi:hypothetical protein Lal_00028722 [Lupinus albus]|uniref:Uncharacterized protein n=1 Tax=Lupinus albus TaxID=3870 RepID=A0A6A4NKM5_LUPAL|nr:hypothetical protein Lalb_Chr19g0131321 [Lupinus albus]KAF1884835.1 hypothetical protein Lal_00028722 [Lupinus albus]
MLDSILEFITEAASSSAFIFCFCNLIIVIILVDLKPRLTIHQESEIPLSMDASQKQGTHFKHPKDTESSPEEVHTESKAIAVNNIETKGNDDWNIEEEEKEEVEEEEEEKEEEEEDEEEEEEEDDELKRRVEEFIEKVNRGWKQESLSTSS